MKILMVNKFLYPNGGSESYIFKLGDFYKQNGHEVEYFGMEHEGRIVSNSANVYTRNMDFHGSKLSKLLYPFRIIYSWETRKKIRKELDLFQPDIVHLNNFNFQLTPSAIVEIKKYCRDTKRKVKIFFTAHDYQLICPNHMMNNPGTKENCEKCVGKKFFECTKNKCIHNSTIRSLLGTIEAVYWNKRNIYSNLDCIICPSSFMAEKMNTNPVFRDKTVTLHNFIDNIPFQVEKKEDYILYFGRYSEEKGIGTLLNVCKSLPDIPFVFAGSGPLSDKIDKVLNVKNVGFTTGDKLENLIRKARFSVYTSEWYENCPFSVMESQMYGTPVLAAKIGGIPELIMEGKTGELFESGNEQALRNAIEGMWNDKKKLEEYSRNCENITFDNVRVYGDKLMKLYKEV